MCNLQNQPCRICWIYDIRFRSKTRRYRIFPRNSAAKLWNSSRHRIILSRNINITVTQTNQKYFYLVLYSLLRINKSPLIDSSAMHAMHFTGRQWRLLLWVSSCNSQSEPLPEITNCRLSSINIRCHWQITERTNALNTVSFGLLSKLYVLFGNMYLWIRRCQLLCYNDPCINVLIILSNR